MRTLGTGKYAFFTRTSKQKDPFSSEKSRKLGLVYLLWSRGIKPPTLFFTGQFFNLIVISRSISKFCRFIYSIFRFAVDLIFSLKIKFDSIASTTLYLQYAMPLRFCCIDYRYYPKVNKPNLVLSNTWYRYSVFLWN